MSQIELTSENFAEIVNRDDIVVALFWPPDDASSQAFTPVFDTAALRHDDVTFGKINADEQIEIAAALSVVSAPTLLFVRYGVVVHTQTGSLNPEELDRVIDRTRQFNAEDAPLDSSRFGMVDKTGLKGKRGSQVDLTSENFAEIIDHDDFVIVFFWASWCGPCRVFARTFDAAALKHGDVTFAKINIDEQHELATIHHIIAIPTLMLIRNGVVVHAQIGPLNPEAFDRVIDRARQS